MIQGVTVSFQVHLGRTAKGRVELREGATPSASAHSGTIPRVSRLMALAIRMERLVREGKVRDYADLARLGHVSRARVSQVMNLLQLAPDIQEALLFLPRTVRGRDPISEHDLRPIAHQCDWDQQRAVWALVVASTH